jgi:predicted dehydrogenase
MDGNSRIRMGIIGAGFIGRIHAAAFREHPAVDVVGITDQQRALADAAAATYTIPKVYESAESLIDDLELDAVVVGVPNKHHAPLTIRALELDKHVLLEKPMALHAEDAKRIVQAERQHRGVLMVAHQMRWHWLASQVKQQVELGELGRVYYAKAGMMRKKAIPGWGSWFTRKDESGGGPLIDIGVHILDLILWLMGNPRPVSVFGATYAEFGPKKRGIGSWGTPEWDGYFDVEDLASAMVRMEDGATLTLEVSWAVNTDSDNGHYIHLIGNEGGASLYPGSAKFISQAFDRSYDIGVAPPQNAPDPRTLLSRHFVDCVLEGKRPISDGMSGLVNNMILESIYQSAASNEVVHIDWSQVESELSRT